MNELLCLKWNNHNSSFIKLLEKIYYKDIYSDATILCDGKYYPVHRLVLSTCSEYFEDIFSQCKMMNTKHPFIIVKDIVHEQMEALLSYMYKGEVNVPQEMLPNLIKAAESFRIKGLAVPDEEEKNISRKRYNTSVDSSPKKKNLRSSHSYSGNISDTGKEQVEAVHEVNGSSNEQNFIDSRGVKIERDDDGLGVLLFNEDCSQKEGITNITSPSIQSRGIKIEMDALGVPFNEEYNKKKSIDIIDPSIQENRRAKPERDEVAVGVPVDFNKECSQKESINIRNPLIQHTPWSPNSYNDADENIFQSDNLEDSQTFENVSFVSPDGKNLQDSLVQKSKEARIKKGTLTYNCPICSYNSVHLSNLKKHLRIHSGERPFSCSLCDFTATQKIVIDRHEMKHTGAKPFECLYCPYRTNAKRNLKMHTFNIHEKGNFISLLGV